MWWRRERGRRGGEEVQGKEGGEEEGGAEEGGGWFPHEEWSGVERGGNAAVSLTFSVYLGLLSEFLLPLRSRRERGERDCRLV